MALCQQIRDIGLVAIDTEFIRETTYYPILCLIQINVNNKSVALDVLAKDINLEPLFAIISDEKIIKIFHSARQDLEVLILAVKAKKNTNEEIAQEFNPQSSNDWNSNLKSIFDTQIMANFCGFDYNIGYASLVKQILGKNLDKELQRSNWQIRPLSKSQMEYCLKDVIYLPQIYQQLIQKITKLNRLDWLFQEMNLIIKKTNYQTEEKNLFKKFSCYNKDKIYQKNIQLLLPWRDHLARKLNLPNSFIIKDDLIDKIASLDPRDLTSLENCSPKVKSVNLDFKKQIIDILNQKNSTNDNQVQQINRSLERVNFRLSEEQNILYQKARSLLQSKAKQHNLKPEFIINKNDLRSIILGNETVEQVLSGWRFEVLGLDLKKIIQKT